MPTMKGLLFNQFAAEGLNSLVEEMQSKYTTKKGRRFNHNNVTYEVSRPSLNDGAIEYEIIQKSLKMKLRGPKRCRLILHRSKKFFPRANLNLTKIKLRPKCKMVFSHEFSIP